MNTKKEEVKIAMLIVIVVFVLLGFLLIKLISDNISLKERQKEVKIELDCVDLYTSIEHIKKYETLQLETYNLDGWYIGYGYKLDKPIPPISEQKAGELLFEILKEKLKIVVNTYDYTGNQALAIAILMYNTGEVNVFNSRLHKALLQHDMDKIKAEWLSFCYFRGKIHLQIAERREFEFNMFKNKIYGIHN